MEKMKVHSQEEMQGFILEEKSIAAKGDSIVNDYLIGLAIREAREARHLTQEQLGEKIGVRKARICSIEKGVNLRLSTLRRIFVALGLEVKLDIAEMQPIPIC